MKVLYVNHQLSFNLCGGAEIQMINTMKSIHSLQDNINIKLFDLWKDKIEDYDIVHIFSPKAFPLESFKIAKYAKDHNVKVIISPVFFQSSGILKETNNSKLPYKFWDFLVNFRNFISKMKFFRFMDPYKYFELTLQLSDAILPNTNDELKFLLNRFSNIPQNKCFLVPNGVDSKFKYGNPELFIDKYNIKDFVLFVGRIEPRKNIIRLITSFNNSKLDTKLIIIGKNEDLNYYNSCKNISKDNVIFIPQISNSSEMLKSAYKSAKVVILPSYLETPGLAALEGGLSGANIVITEIGGTKEYFHNYAWYVNPLSKDSIKKALISAYNSPKKEKLSQHIENNFSWEEVAKKTIIAYNNLFNE